MSLVFNEQIEPLATAFNTAATSCFTVGIATPLAGYIYNVGNLHGTIGAWTLGLGACGWFWAAVSLHLIARRTLRGLR